MSKANEPTTIFKFKCKKCGEEHTFGMTRSQMKQYIKKMDRDVRDGKLIKIED